MLRLLADHIRAERQGFRAIAEAVRQVLVAVAAETERIERERERSERRRREQAH